MKHTKELPWFYELAEARIEPRPDGKRIKTVDVKIAALTCKMMIEREKEAIAAAREALKRVRYKLADWPAFNEFIQITISAKERAAILQALELLGEQEPGPEKPS